MGSGVGPGMPEGEVHKQACEPQVLTLQLL
jgi:hypothetical protein